MACLVKSIRYGELRFSNFVNSNVEMVAIVSDDQIVIPRWKVTVEVSTIITVETASLDPVGGGVDLHMDSVKSVLMKPGLLLEFTYRGFGTDAIWSGSEDLAFRAIPELLAWEPLVTNTAVRVTWRCTAYAATCPVVNMMLAVPVDVLPPNEQAVFTENLLQVVEEQDVTISPEGAMQISIIGTMTFTGSYASGNKINSKRLQAIYAHYFDHNQLPRFHRTYKLRFNKDRRSVSYVVTDTEIPSDNAHFPYMVKCHVEHTMSSSLLSEDAFAGAGFTTWLNRFVGRFTVAPHTPKAYAWTAFLVYLYNRQARVPNGISDAGLPDMAKDEETQENTTTDPEKFIKPFQVPLSIEIGEVLTGREVNIEMTYLVKSSLDKLFRHTGMFYPVDTKWKVGAAPLALGEVPTVQVTDPNTTTPRNVVVPPILDANPPDGFGTSFSAEPLSVQWKLYSAQLKTHQRALGHNKAALPAYNVVFDPCDDYALAYSNRRKTSHLFQDDSIAFPEQIDPEVAVTHNAVSRILGIIKSGPLNPLIQTSQSAYLNNAGPEQTWLVYAPEFELIEVANNAYLPSIEDVAPSTWSHSPSSLTNAKRNQSGFRINGNVAKIADSNYANHGIQPIGLPLYKVRMTGYAMRAGISIPCPCLVGVHSTDNSNNPSMLMTYRTGESRWKHTLVNTSADIPVYLAMWDVTYAVHGDPTSGNIRFESLSRAKFA
jgi:hypothetical protein